MLSTTYRKSSYSGSGGTCLEAAVDVDGNVLVRDTEDRRPAHTLKLGPEEWDVFLGDVKAGRF